MKIAFFFTYGYSLKTWKESGTLERELKTLEILSNKYDYKFTLITYGDVEDKTIIKNYKNFQIIPIYTIIKRRKNKLLNYLISFFIPFKLRKYLTDIDIIHQHQLLGSWISIILKLILKKPLLTRTGYDMYLFAKKDNKSFYISMLYNLLTKVTIYFSNYYTVTSLTDFKYLNSKYKIKNRLLYRPNYIELGLNSPLEKRFENTVLCVGRLVNQKNFKLLISEFKNTKNEFEIHIVGEGYLKDELKSFALENNVNLKLLGSMEYKELKKLYQQYKFFISTSLFEGNPKTLLEAMASGCIVLASNISNHSEIIKNEINGFIFSLNEPKLLETLYKLKSNTKLENQISCNSVKHVKEHNSLDNLIKLLDNDYKNLNLER